MNPRHAFLILFFLSATVLAIPTTALFCRARLARRRRVSFGTVLSGAVTAAFIANIAILILIGDVDVFTAEFWNDAKRWTTFGDVLLGVLGAGLPCALVAFVVVAYYQSKREYKKDAGRAVTLEFPPPSHKAGMGNRVKCVLAVVFLALVGVIGWQVWPPSEPLYQNRPLTSWMEVYTLGSYTPLDIKNLSGAAVSEADETIRQIGSNAIPTLLRLLRARDPALKFNAMSTPAASWNAAAYHGFAALGESAQSAVPSLIEIVNQNISPTSQGCAIASLGAIGPSAKEAVPTLLRWGTNASEEVNCWIAPALGAIHAQEGVPLLQQYATNAHVNVRIQAILALRQIDPEAAAKVERR
jgi:hypothetical protein